MIIKTLIIILCVLAFLIAGGFLLAGLARNNKKMWQNSLIAIVASVMIPSFIIVKGISDTIDYAGTEEMQKDVRKFAGSVGEATGNASSGYVEGLSEGLDEEAFAKLANKSARILGRGIEATAQGLDGTLGKTVLFTTQQADQLGLVPGRSSSSGSGSGSSVSIFMEFKKPFKGILKLESFDAEGQIMDVSEKRIEAKAEDQKHLTFKFNKNGPGLSGYSTLYAYPEE